MAKWRIMVRLREWRHDQTKELSDSDRILQRELLLGALAMVAIGIPVWFLVNANEDALWRWAITWLPIVPFGLIVRAFVRAYRREDELLQKRTLEALSFAFIGTVLVTLGYGSLQRAGAPDVDWNFVVPLMWVLWTVSDQIVKRRYE